MNIGDLVAIRPVAISEVQRGDVITYATATDFITHRVVDLATTPDGRPGLILRGDANGNNDPIVTADQIRGRVMYQVPLVGHAIAWSRGNVPIAGAIFATLAAGMITAWYFDKKHPEADALAGATENGEAALALDGAAIASLAQVAQPQLAQPQVAQPQFVPQLHGYGALMPYQHANYPNPGYQNTGHQNPNYPAPAFNHVPGFQGQGFHAGQGFNPEQGLHAVFNAQPQANFAANTAATVNLDVRATELELKAKELELRERELDLARRELSLVQAVHPSDELTLF
jgi:hypothetical protein